MSASRSSHGLAPLVFALALMSPSGCAISPEVSLCQVDGALLGNNLYINVVGYVRVYGTDPYEGRGTVTVLDASGRPVQGFMANSYNLVESGGNYLCAYTTEQNGASTTQRLGIGPYPVAMLGNIRTLQVRLTMTERGGATQTATLPLTRIRDVEDMPNFTCGSSHCGR